MDPQRHAKISDIFVAVADAPADQRADLLDRLCLGDAALRCEVEELLAHDSKPAVLDEPLGSAGAWTAALDSPGDAAAVPRRIGRYEIIDLLGQGGMGTVFRARQAQPSRMVALKVINPALLTPNLVNRFEFEAQVLGELHHPGIAEIYEAGTASVQGSRVPFFAMELIDGQPLTGHAQSRSLDRRARIELMVKVCQAVHHAHQKGVIHRDLKPGNILVTDAGQPKILDFGVARTTTPELRTQTLQTRPGQIVGTLPYMSPEQLSGQSQAIDVRSDIYALGVVAYELLSGRLPIDPAGKSIAEAARAIEVTPPPTLGRLDASLRGDVEIIVGKAMDKDVTRRYGSAAELSRELERYLAGEAIDARRDSRVYVLRKAIVRHRIPVTVACAFFVVLAGATAVSVSFAISESHQRSLAVQRADETMQVADFQSAMLRGLNVESMGRWIKEKLRNQIESSLAQSSVGDSLDRRPRTPNEIEQQLSAFDALVAPTPGADVARSVLDEFVLAPAADAIESQFAGQPAVQAQLQDAVGRMYFDLGLYDRAEPHLRAAVELRKEGTADQNMALAGSLSALAGLCQAQDRFDEALTLYQRSLDLMASAAGADSREFASINVDYANALSNRGRFDEAEPRFDEALGVLRAQGGAFQADVASALNSLGEMLRRKGDIARAEAAHREALDIRKSLHHDDNSDVAISLNNLANLLTEAGRFGEAEPLQREALDVQRRLLGVEHPYSIACLQNLANTWRAIGNYGEAEAGFKEAITLYRKLNAGVSDISLAGSLVGLGLVYQSTGRIDEGEPLLREAVSIFAAENPSSASYAVALGNLAVMMHLKGDREAAEPIYKQCIEIRRGLPNYEHVDTALLLNNYAALMRDRGDFEHSEPVYRQAIEIFSKTAPEHPAIATSQAGLARVIAGQGRYADAEPVYRDAIAGLQRFLPPGHPQIAMNQARFGVLLSRLARFDEGEALLAVAREALDPSGDAPPSPPLLLVIESSAEFYEVWDLSAPGAGHDAQADRWRRRLSELR